MPLFSSSRGSGDDRGADRRAGVWGLWAGGVALALVLVAGLGGFWRGREDSWTRVREAGVVRVGYAIEAPYAYLDRDGRLTGESPEIAGRVAGRLGLRVEWRLTEFGALIEELEAGNFDVIAAGMFVTPEREARVAFSRPTFEVRPGLLVARGNPFGLREAEQLTRVPGPHVAVLSGAVEAAALPASNVVRVPDTASGLALLKTGRVQALRLSRPTVRWMAAGDETLESVESFGEADGEGAGRVAFAFRRADRALRAEWDRELGGFMRGADYREIAARFGFDPLAEGEGAP